MAPLALLLGLLSLSTLVMCGDDDPSSAAADPSATDASGDAASATDGAAGDASVVDATATSDASVTDSASGDGAGPDDAADDGSADAADSGPSVHALLVLCGNAPVGGAAAVYAVDDRAGALTHVDQNAAEAGVQDFPAGMNTLYSAVNPTGRAFYCSRGLADGLHPTIGSFGIDDAGAVQDLGGAAIEHQPKSVAVHPSGGTLYAIGTSVTFSNGVYSFPLSPSGAIGAGGYAGWAGTATFLAVDRLGRFVFAGGGNQLWVHRTSAADAGALSLAAFHLPDGGGFAGYDVYGAGDPKRIVTHPSLDVLYVAFSTSLIGAYAYDGTTGAFTPLGTLPSDASPSGMAVHPDGKRLFVAHDGAAKIDVYTLGTNGALASRASVTAAAATALTLDPSGTYVYTTTGADVRGYAILPDGGLGSVPSGPAPGPGSSSGNVNDVSAIARP